MLADIEAISTNIATFLRAFLAPDQVTELRVLPFAGNKVASGFYDASHIDQMAREAAHQSGTASGVYFVPNPLKPELIDRRKNRCCIGKPKNGGMALDTDVLRRHWLIIDIDPVRAPGHEKDSASDAEKFAAMTLALKVGDWLASVGWLPPLTIDSGNGVHLYYRLPAADQSTTAIPTLLTALATLFSPESHAAHIDTAIGNPARIMKLPGTMSCKGTKTVERPWRTAGIVGSIPSTWGDYPTMPAGSASLISATIAACEAALPAGVTLPTRQAKTTTAPVTLPPRLSAVGTTHYGAKALTEECLKIANAAPGTRNNTLFAAAAAVLELVAGGEIDAGEADAAIRTAAAACGLEEGEVNTSLRSAAATTAGKPRQANGLGAGSDLPDIPEFGEQAEKSPPPAPVPTSRSYTTPAITYAAVHSGPPQLRNYRISTNEQGEQKEVGRPLGEITNEIFAKACGWPKRIGTQLFVERQRRGDVTVDFLTDSTQLFVWLSSIYEPTSGNGAPGIDWGKGSDKPTRDDLYQSLLVAATEYDSVELYPHYPPIPNVWYCHRPLPTDATGADLGKFVAMFNPATDADSDLIRASILTMFWGGDAGQRPGFLITVDIDDGDGRGYGKTTLAHRVSELVGGFVRVNPNSNREATTILLAPGAMVKRVALVDNLKSLHFSSAEIESLITCPTIDGNKLHAGYGSRPNFLSWFVTVNGGNLSKDLSQRLIPVYLEKPTYDSAWGTDMDQMISERRWHIIADAIAELRSKPTANFEVSSRHGMWERGVLAKLSEPQKLASLISARKSATDGDADDVQEIEAAIATALRLKGFNPEEDIVWIDTKSLADIVKPFAGYTNVISIMRWLFCLPLKRLTKSKNKSKRGGVWNHEEGKYTQRYDAPGLPDIPL